MGPASNTGTSPPGLGGSQAQIAEAQDHGDDWSGVSAADRRRLQNRLNQRAFRRRRRERVAASDQALISPTGSESEITGPSIPDGYVIMVKPRARTLAHAFTELVYMQYSMQSYKLAYLPALIRLNTINALTSNACAIGITPGGLCRDDILSPFNASGPDLFRHDQSFDNRCPVSLRPTALQKKLPHHPWTDLLPSAGLRDNVLKGLETGEVDEDELCLDLMEISQSHSEDGPYLIVWGEASDPYNWEASIGFLKKWGRLIQGCPELVVSTNRWRSKRGEKELNIRV